MVMVVTCHCGRSAARDPLNWVWRAGILLVARARILLTTSTRYNLQVPSGNPRSLSITTRDKDTSTLNLEKRIYFQCTFNNFDIKHFVINPIV